MSQGNLADYIAAYPGDPSGISTTIFDCKPGTIVNDSLSGGQYKKVSPLGDNTVYVRSDATKTFSENFLSSDTADTFSSFTQAGASFSNTAQALNLLYTPKANILLQYPLGTGFTGVTNVANGASLGGTYTSGRGVELAAGILGATGRPFVVGFDPAFFIQATFSVATVANALTFLVGFRKPQVAAAGYASYTDFAAIGLAAASIFTRTSIASSATNTDSTQTIANAAVLTVRINVSASGICTFQHDGVTTGTLAAPTAVPSTANATMADGLQLIPFIFYISGASDPGEVALRSLTVGYQ
jgi:hypothetical protein